MLAHLRLAKVLSMTFTIQEGIEILASLVAMEYLKGNLLFCFLTSNP